MDVLSGRFGVRLWWPLILATTTALNAAERNPSYPSAAGPPHTEIVPARCAPPNPEFGFGASGLGGSSGRITRGWETIPGVVRADGSEDFRLEVSTSDAVKAVRVELDWPVQGRSGQRQISCRDDGQLQDRAAGDFVFTSEALRCDPSFEPPELFRRDPDSPRGISFATVGRVQIEEMDGATNQFLIMPSIGLIDPGMGVAPIRVLSDELQATPYLLNVRSTQRWTQQQLRLLDFGMRNLTTAIYRHLPDEFDFFVFFSADHLEALPTHAGNNFNAGLHQSIRVNFTGTGQAPFDHGAVYGSNGRLLGLNILDVYERGIYSQNLTHEISHQWGAFTSPLLGLNDREAHYKARSSAASLLGGVEFVPGDDMTFTLNCAQGRAQARHAPPLDKYLMGLVEARAVLPLRVYSEALPPPFLMCGQAVSNFEATITIDQIQAAHGDRLPGPDTAQRAFSLGFVVESYRRLLTPSELTFYDLLAKTYTRPFSPGTEAPPHAFNWVSINSYVGEGTIWKSQIESLTAPRLASADHLWEGTRRLSGSGFPQLEYVLQVSTNLTQWTALSSVRADAIGAFEAFDYASGVSPVRFYRFLRP